MAPKSVGGGFDLRAKRDPHSRLFKQQSSPRSEEHSLPDDEFVSSNAPAAMGAKSEHRQESECRSGGSIFSPLLDFSNNAVIGGENPAGFPSQQEDRSLVQRDVSLAPLSLPPTTESLLDLSSDATSGSASPPTQCDRAGFPRESPPPVGGGMSPLLLPSGAFPKATEPPLSSEAREYPIFGLSAYEPDPSQRKAAPQALSLEGIADRRAFLGGDVRGRQPPFRRWRLYCFQHAFVVEPNLSNAGMRQNRDDLAALVKGVGSPEFLQSTSLPQLIIFRDSDVIVEVPNSSHQLYRSFGILHHLFLFDSLVGIVRIADARFLSIVADSEAVAGFTDTDDDDNDDAVKPDYRGTATGETAGATADTVGLTSNAAGGRFTTDGGVHHGLSGSENPTSAVVICPNAFIYRISRAWLIPFHLPLDRLEQCPRALIQKGGGGVYFDFNAADTSRRRSRQFARRRRDSVDAQSDKGETTKQRNNRRRSLVVQSKCPSESPPPVGLSAADMSGEDDPLSDSRRKSDTNVGRRPVPVSVATWDWVGFGDNAFCSLLGEKLSMYKNSVEKLLCTNFYYSYDIEITHTMQRKSQLGISSLRQGWPCNLAHKNEAPHHHRSSSSSSSSSDRNPKKYYYHSTTDLISLDLSSEGGNDPAKDLNNKSLLFSAREPQKKLRAGGAEFSAKFSAPKPVGLMDVADRRFTWNYDACQPFFSWGVDSRWLVPILQGSVTSASLKAGAHRIELVLLCRRSCRRAGTRYIHRGLDDAGNVANFNESEQLVASSRAEHETGQHCGLRWASFVQVRGSVPVFWQQQTPSLSMLNLTQPSFAPALTRELEFAWLAFCKHHEELQRIYGDVTYVNLLSTTRNGEPKLTKALTKMVTRYADLCSSSSEEIVEGEVATGEVEASYAHTPSVSSCTVKTSTIQQPAEIKRLRHIHWDFHHQVKAQGFEEALLSFVSLISGDLRLYGFFCDCDGAEETPHLQTGVIRTNCLDCLDRTNAIQYALCWHWLCSYLRQRGLKVFAVPAYKISETLVRDSRGGASSEARNLQRLPSSSVGSEATDQRSPSPFFERKGKVVHGVAVQLPAGNIHPHHPRHLRRPKLKRGTPRMATTTGDIVIRYFGGSEGEVTSVFRPAADARPVPSSSSSMMRVIRPEPNADQEIEEALAPEGELVANVLRAVVSGMWADHGDHISRAYTGTSSVLSGLVRQGKSSIVTNVGHVMTSFGRLLQNAFEDPAKQEAIELLLNQHGLLSRQPAALLPCEMAAGSPLSSTSAKPFLPAQPPKQTEATLRVWFGTWNLGGRQASESLERWMMPTGNRKKPLVADVYVVAIQELVELTGMRVLLSQNDKDKEWQMELNIRRTLGAGFQMVGASSNPYRYTVTQLFMYISDERSALKHLITEVQISELKLGFKGQMGNKGAVMLRARIGTNSFCFINVHLSPGQEKAQQRRSQLQTILGCTFPGRGMPSVRHHDFVLVGGDFNFCCDIEREHAEDLLERGMWRDVLKQDQYLLCKRLGVPPFPDLHEPPINFPPTYKFVRGSSVYDATRLPCWCDRVLFAGDVVQSSADPKKLIRCLAYEGLHDFLSSDHKPVCSVFRVVVSLLDTTQSSPARTRPIIAPAETRTDAAAAPIANSVLSTCSVRGSGDDRQPKRSDTHGKDGQQTESNLHVIQWLESQGRAAWASANRITVAVDDVRHFAESTLGADDIGQRFPRALD